LGREKFDAVAAAAAEAHASLAYVPSADVSSDTWADQIDIDGLLLMTVSAPRSRSLYDITKRVFDFVVSVILLILFSPLVAALALAVRLDSEGPIIFKQSRVGKNGRLFDIYKFRSMRMDAPKY